VTQVSEVVDGSATRFSAVNLYVDKSPQRDNQNDVAESMQIFPEEFFLSGIDHSDCASKELLL